MESAQLLQWISDYGYFALFFCLWLGIVGMPIPEVIVMTGGLVSSLHILKPIPSFFITYLGVISGLAIGYFIGRSLGMKIYHWLEQKRNWDKYVSLSERLIQKYGHYGLCISYFLPMIRHLLPYLVGSHRMSFSKYALFSFTTGIIWTSLYFWLGL